MSGGCERVRGDPWFRDCSTVECGTEDGLVVARGAGCLEPTLSLYSVSLEPLESPGAIRGALMEGAHWIDGPPESIENVAVASVARRSVLVEAEAPPYGRVLVKVFKKHSGSGREEEVLRLLRGSPLLPRLLAYYRAAGATYMLVYEQVEGAPMASNFIEAALESLWSGSPREPRCARPLGRAVALLHKEMRGLPGRLSPRSPSTSDAEAWIARIEARARRLPQLAPGDGEIAEAAETLIWLAGEWRERGLQLLASGEVQALHGDLHLYQVYEASGCRIVFTDFEGEPIKEPGSPWDLEHRERDLAALQRSIVYAAALAAERASGRGIDEAARVALTEPLKAWSEGVFNSLTKAYAATWQTVEASGEPLDPWKLRFWTLERLSYELVYELAYETGYHHVPLWSLMKDPDSYAPP